MPKFIYAPDQKRPGVTRIINLDRVTKIDLLPRTDGGEDAVVYFAADHAVYLTFGDLRAQDALGL